MSLNGCQSSDLNDFITPAAAAALLTRPMAPLSSSALQPFVQQRCRNQLDAAAAATAC